MEMRETTTTFEVHNGEVREVERNEVEIIEHEEQGLKGIKDFLKEEDGMGTVEIILIIVVLIGLVLIFKEQITNVVNSIFGKITKESAKV